MTYKDIINRVAINLSLPAVTSAFLSITKKDIFDVVQAITRKAEYLTDIKTQALALSTATEEHIDLPTDFFFPKEVIFMNADGQVFYSKEVLHETFMRWIPTVYDNEPFGTFDMTTQPEVMNITPENERLDGYLCYTFPDDGSNRMLYKPSVSGTCNIMYVKGMETLPTITSSPDFTFVYHNLVVDGVTLKQLVRSLKGVNDQGAIVSTQIQMKHYREAYADGLGDFTGYVNKTASFEAKEIIPFDFLNDRGMLL